jgi:hypothetical protein
VPNRGATEGVRRCAGREGSPSRKAQGVGDEAKAVSQPTQPQKKLSRRKTASLGRSKAARTAGIDRKTDGVR